MTEERAVTIKEVCERLSMGTSTFYRLINAHQLPLVEAPRLGRKRRFLASSLDRMLESRWSQKGSVS